MNTITPREAMYERIMQHGRTLLAIFPNAPERDPVKLCKQLRRVEGAAHRLAEEYCNGECDSGQWEARKEAIRARLKRVLGAHSVPVFLNGDPRGYALKIESEWVQAQRVPIHRDWGGYGILAPDLSERDAS